MGVATFKCKKCPYGQVQDGKAGSCKSCPIGYIAKVGGKSCGKLASQDIVDNLSDELNRKFDDLVRMVNALEQGIPETVSNIVKQETGREKAAREKAIAAVKEDVANLRADLGDDLLGKINALQTQVNGIPAAIKAALAAAASTVVTPGMSSSLGNTCRGKPDPINCDKHGAKGCVDQITGSAVKTECPVMCGTCVNNIKRLPQVSPYLTLCAPKIAKARCGTDS